MSLFDSASLVVTPSGYKEDKLYSIKPTDGSGDLVVTRATTATRVNSAGLIEQVAYNFATYSIDLNTWTDVSGTGIGIIKTLNAAISPEGINNAISLIPTTNTGSKMLYNNLSVIASGGTFTMSCYAKANGYSKFALRESQSVGYYASFNLSNGTVIDNGGNTASIQSVGNGWYRCVCTVTDSIDVNLGLIILNDSYTSGTPFPFSYAGNGTSGILIYGPQINSGATAKEYFPTTDRLNVPRLDYTNSSCPSILVEPQRTNLLSYSEQFNNAIWGAPANVIANTVVSPDGTTTGDTLTGGLYRLQVFSSITYVFSFYAKKNAQSTFSMRVDAPTNQTFTFNLDTGTADGGCSMVNVGNGWYRCFMPFTSSLAGTGVFYPNVGGNNFYIWGAQLEAGSYATSYIPTVASSVTRNADVISKTGISSLIGQTEGTFYLDIDLKNIPINNSYIFLRNAGVTNYLGLRILNGLVRFETVTGGSLQTSISYAISEIGTIKVAMAYKLNDFVFYINGIQIGVDNSATVPTCDILDLNFDAPPNNAFAIKTTALWKTRLTNAELISLTTI